MKDRNVEFPNRYQLVKVKGTDDVFDIIPAPGEVAEEGTMINKSSLLSDAVAASFGLGAYALPNDALSVLSRLHSGLANEYVWAKVIEGTFYKENRSSPNIITIYNSNAGTCGKTIKISQTDGSVTITDVIASQPFVTGYGSYWSAKIPFYCQYGSTLYYVDGVMENEGSAGIRFSQVCTVTITSEEGFESFGYVNSPDHNAYPPAVDDGYTYTALGMLGEKVRVATGSYTGNGNHNSGSINSLTFDFEPKLVIIRTNENSGQNGNVYGATLVRHDTGGYLFQYNDTYGMYGSNLQVKWTGNTVYYYTTMGYPGDQLNTATVKYYYVAIG